VNGFSADDLVALLRNRPRAEDEDFICKQAGITKDELLAVLPGALASASVVRTKKGRYSTPEQLALIPCRVTSGGSLLFGRPLDETLRQELHGDIRLDMPSDSAWPDDIVLVRLTDSSAKARGTLEAIAKKYELTEQLVWNQK